MKRQKRYTNNYSILDDNDDCQITMQRIGQPRFENAIEAVVQDGDTVQAIALRFHCTVAEIRRMNKIDKDNEIYARKTIKVPITPHSILLETLPVIHKSGQSSPKRNHKDTEKSPLESGRLNEKLMVATVATTDNKPDSIKNSINSIILNSRVTPNLYTDTQGGGATDVLHESLLSGEIDDSIPHPRPIPGLSKSSFDCSGSDCDISWICLFICILALCFAIPLIYVFYIAEHPERFHHNSN